MAMSALGRLFDACPVIAPIDFETSSGKGGNLVAMKDAGVITFLVYLDAAASGVEDVVVTVREATDGAGTGEQDLDVVTEYWRKAEATLDNDETWTRVTQTAGDITIAGATYATSEVLVAFSVRSAQLSANYTHVTVDLSDPGTVDRFGCVLGLRGDLDVQRAPENLAAPQ